MNYFTVSKYINIHIIRILYFSAKSSIGWILSLSHYLITIFLGGGVWAGFGASDCLFSRSHYLISSWFWGSGLGFSVITRISIPGLKPWRSHKDNRFMYLTFYYAHSGKQITSGLSHIITSLYMSREKYILYLYYAGSKNWEPGTCGASASSMLREGDWSHVEYMTFRD